MLVLSGKPGGDG